MEKHGVDAARIRTLRDWRAGNIGACSTRWTSRSILFPIPEGSRPAIPCGWAARGGPRRQLRLCAIEYDVLVNAGLAELVAADEPQYLDIAVRLANAVPALAALRGGMRERLARSPLLDAPRFVEALEQLYRDAWRRAVGAREAAC